MKKYVKKKDRYTNEESKFIKGKWKTRYFHLYCDICGVKHPDICVNELCEEEGFPDGDYCYECQLCMNKQSFVGEDKSYYFYKPSWLKGKWRKLVRLAKGWTEWKDKNNVTMDEKVRKNKQSNLTLHT